MRLQMRAETAFGILSPLLLWSVYFLSVYLLVAIACARLTEVSWVRPTLWLASMGTVLATLWITQCFRQRLRQDAASPASEQHTRLRMGLFMSIIALIAVIWTALPTLFLNPCQ